MSESQQLIKQLKKQLKLRDIQYVDIANHLELSEGSVKRLLASGTQISLERLSKICDLIGMEMSELFALVAQDSKTLQGLTFDQEKQIVDDKVLLMVAVCVMNGFLFDEILARYPLGQTTLIQKLAELDRLGIIELQPGNRVKLMLSPDFNWIAGGPIQTFFLNDVLSEFFRSYFNRQDEKLVLATGLMTPLTNQKFQQRLQRLVDEFYSACHDDKQLGIDERNGTSLVVALRRWHFDLFDQINNTTNTE